MSETQTDLPNARPSPLAALQVLLVDDDPFMLELLSGMLRTMGVSRIAVAADGERGVAAMTGGRFTPDVIICDLNMPGKDGFQVMEALAAHGYKGGVVLLSGMEERILNSAALMGRFHQLNVIGVVTKPVSKAALASILASAQKGRA